MKLGKKGILSLIGGVFLTSIITFSLVNKSKISGSKENPGSLFIKAVSVWDNGEGDGGIHGPEGRIKYLIFPSKQKCLKDQKKFKDYLKKGILMGFHGPKKDEWLDGEIETYANFKIWDWKKENDEILLLIYESDASYLGILPFIPIPFREHDTLFCKKIKRKDTLDDIPKKYSSRYKISGDVFEKFKKDPEMIRKIESFSGKYFDSDLPKMSLFLKTENE